MVDEDNSKRRLESPEKQGSAELKTKVQRLYKRVRSARGLCRCQGKNSSRPDESASSEDQPEKTELGSCCQESVCLLGIKT